MTPDDIARLFIIPVKASSIEDVIPVGGKSEIAEYFLTQDAAATVAQKVIFTLASDFILNVVLSAVSVSPRRAYLSYVYRRLECGMYSNFCWGDEAFVRKYFT